MSNQLLPCPFCGGKADIESDDSDYPCHEAVCQECGARCHVTGCGPDDGWEWNRRATQTAAGEPVYQWREDCNQRWWETSKADYEWILENRPGCQARILWKTPPAAAPVVVGEPVAWMVKKTFNGLEKTIELTEHKHIADFLIAEYSNGTDRLIPLYAAPPAAAHGDEAVAVVGTVPDGSGFKSLDFKVELQSLPNGTRLYAAAHGDGRSDADYAIEHGRYLANDADKFMKALNDAFDPETEEADLNDESISEARKRLASSVYEFRKRADRAMRTKGSAAHGDEAVRKMVLPERIDRRQYLGGRGDAVAQGWNDCLNWIDKANAMRALGDGEVQ